MKTVATLIETEDGSHSLRSTQFGVSYHSKYGAIQESKHVFIEAGLAPVANTKSDIRILEMGFGTGLNAYLSLLYGQQYQKSIYFETVETAPISGEQAQSLNYPALLKADSKEFIDLHTANWDTVVAVTPEFTLCKWLNDVQEAPLSGNFDVVFFDAFAPSSQPELWEAPVLEKLFQALSPGGIFVTYCAKGVVKRCLRSIGFTIEGIPGPPGKREMTRGIKPM